MMHYNLYDLMKPPGYTPSPTFLLTFQDSATQTEFEETARKVGDQLLRQSYPLLDGGRVVEGYKLLKQAECYGRSLV